MLRQAPWSVLRLCRPHSHMRIQVCEIHPSLGDCELVDDLVTWIIENHERRRVNAHKLENRKWLQECFRFRHPIWRIFFRWVVQPSPEFASQPHFTCFLNLSGLCWHRQRSGCLSSLIDLWDLQFGVHVLYLRPSPWASQDMCCCHVAPSLGLWVSGEPCFHLWKDSSLSLSLYLGALIQAVPPFVNKIPARKWRLFPMCMSAFVIWQATNFSFNYSNDVTSIVTGISPERSAAMSDDLGDGRMHILLRFWYPCTKSS